MKKVPNPCAYQGGKRLLAPRILDLIGIPDGSLLVDLCCGSGAMSIEAVNRGKSPSEIVMVDAGPWGVFWNKVGSGEFDMMTLRAYLNDYPKDIRLIRGYMEELAQQDALKDTAEVFLILQSGAFGGKPVSVEAEVWAHHGFVGPRFDDTPGGRIVSPAPRTLLSRMETICEQMFGVRGIEGDARLWARFYATEPNPTALYLDPPYRTGTGYRHELDTPALIESVLERRTDYVALAVSDSVAYPGAETYDLGKGQGTTLSGRKAKPHSEWLSIWP